MFARPCIFPSRVPGNFCLKIHMHQVNEVYVRYTRGTESAFVTRDGLWIIELSAHDIWNFQRFFRHRYGGAVFSRFSKNTRDCTSVRRNIPSNSAHDKLDAPDRPSRRDDLITRVIEQTQQRSAQRTFVRSHCSRCTFSHAEISINHAAYDPPNKHTYRSTAFGELRHVAEREIDSVHVIRKFAEPSGIN